MSRPPQKIRKITSYFNIAASNQQSVATTNTSVPESVRGRYNSSSTEPVPLHISEPTSSSSIEPITRHVSESNDKVENRYAAMDIGNFIVNRLSLPTHSKSDILQNVWIPPVYYQFPKYTRLVKEKERNCSFQREWLTTFNWLAYSAVHEGGFCKSCVCFAPENVSGTPLGLLVNDAFSGAHNFANGRQRLRDHAATNHHQIATVNTSSFISSLATGSVADQMSVASQQQLRQKKDYLEGMAMTIHLLGRQGIALRGHRDIGPLSKEQTVENEGNLRSVLNLLIERDDRKIKNYVENAPKNALYVSWSVQNELINLIAEQIQSQILDEVKQAGFFSVLVDETSDVTNAEQLSIMIRYVHVSNGMAIVKESFLGFSIATDLSGEGLSNQILKLLRDLGLDLNRMRGQGYDGAASMSGKFNGAQAKISAMYPLAVYVHCACHCLNLALLPLVMLALLDVR